MNSVRDVPPGDTGLVAAATAGDATLVGTLLAAGADPDAPDEWGRTPLACAARAGYPDVVAALLAAGSDPWRLGAAHIEGQDSGPKLPLWQAGVVYPTAAGHVEATVLLGRAMRGRPAPEWLASSLAAETQTRTGWLSSCLAQAADGYPAWALGLLEAGADPDGMPLLVAIQCD